MKEEIITFPPYGEHCPLRITLAGVSWCDGSYYIARRGCTQAVFEYVVSGRGSLVVNGEYFYPKAGDVYLIPPGTDHHYASGATQPWHKLWFNVDGPFLLQLLAAFDVLDTILFPNCPLQSLFEEGLEELRKQRRSPEILSMQIIGGLVAALRQFNAAMAQKSTSAPDFQKVIDRKATGSLQLNDFCAISGRSVSQTIRQFRKEFGVTPYAGYLDRKIELAQTLLDNTRCQVKDIAQQLGFNDPAYFSRLFRRKTGLTPLAWRKRPPKNKPERFGYNPLG